MVSDVAGCASISDRRCTLLLLKSKAVLMMTCTNLKHFIVILIQIRHITTVGAFNCKAIDLIKRKYVFAHCNYTSISSLGTQIKNTFR